jgi:uncharacterized protein with ParB-like and HNH nuclease domain
MTEKETGLKSISELMGEKFTIPHYQRGYRWEDQEVTELLDDLWAFQKDKESGNFYCLQPIVLRKNDSGNYDVLDGQQRLTTLYLLLVYLEQQRKDDNYNQILFSLNYATRKNCEKFLSEKQFANNNIDDSNIDFHYMCKAYQCIDNWFKNGKHSGAKNKLVSILLDTSGDGNRNVKVIRYEVEKDTNPIDVFIRLNMGKIPLTDAELTKALLLQLDKYSPEELEFNKMKLHNIATEWDIIETTLQDKAFWYFLNDTSNIKSTHIEFIFDLLANKINSDKQYFKTPPKKYATFLIFSEYLQDLIDNGVDGKKLSRIEAVETIWKSVSEYFEYFKEWFENRILYHYIGFLIAVKGNGIIDSIIQESKQLSKTKFKEHLEQKIAKIVKNEKLLNDWVYEDENGRKVNYKDIINMLLLHNVFTTLNSDKEKPRFPFELYKEQDWSLEHIHAQNSGTITKDKNLWLDEHIQSLTNSKTSDFEELIKRMQDLKEKREEMTNNEFESVFNDIFDDVFTAINNNFEFKDESIHSIRNLCLLDRPTNSQLNNSFFDVKRKKIKKRELEGYYIPICTKNVFLKAYTADPATNAYWTKTDRNDYFNSIENTYNFFVK